MFMNIIGAEGDVVTFSDDIFYKNHEKTKVLNDLIRIMEWFDSKLHKPNSS